MASFWDCHKIPEPFISNVYNLLIINLSIKLFIADPELPNTFPNLTIFIFFISFVIETFTNFSATFFVYPRIETGSAALSVDTNINSQEYLEDNLQIFSVAKILFFTAEKTLFSSIFTCLYADAWKIISTLLDLIIFSKNNLSLTSTNSKLTLLLLNFACCL